MRNEGGVQSSEFRVPSSKFQVPSSEFRVQSSEFRVSKLARHTQSVCMGSEFQVFRVDVWMGKKKYKICKLNKFYGKMRKQKIKEK